MSLDLSPRPGAASRVRRVLGHTAMELRLMSRQGEQLLITVVIPLLVLATGARAGSWLDTDRPLDVVVPGVLALAILSTSFTSLAIATGFERRYGVLRHLGATPLSPHGLFWGKALALLVAELAQGTILVGVALALGWRSPGAPAWAWFAVLLVLGTCAFAGFALLLAGTVRAEITLAAANLVFVLAVAFGGVALPVSRLPGVMQPVVEFLPTGALGEAMRATFTTGQPDLLSVVVLAVWAVLAWLAAVRWFTWE